ncbi:helix-turn-helix domain-containing protein [Alicyclobacillus kakegawensis]|uniref:helix-turn-helix domain-containing protein n=1 Tax=Alicyclobacillus kakegawensis TaxID=392012 RepID=UPI0008360652|nr:helix-turn-helix domain-containing protein [Alicyclobacillus kakegawensis]
MHNRLLTVPQVADMLAVPEHAVYRMAREKLIPVIRIGRLLRFDPEALQKWMAQGGKAFEGGWRKDA